MQYYLVAVLGMVRTDEYRFTYHAAEQLKVGQIVRVPIGRRFGNGVVVQAVAKPSFKTKEISTIITKQPLPKPLIKLVDWLGTYYATHPGVVLQTVLASGLHKQRRQQKNTIHPKRNRTKIVLNLDQEAAIKKINNAQNSTLLLHGVTGSGKTHVYIMAAKHQAALGKSSIILVPEIALTPQLVAEFANHFENLIITHSGLTEAKRHLAWSLALESTAPTVVIGPRSALFMPLKNIGLIVVDECHEASYKQEQSPKYSALRAASVLARFHGATVVLGSATPNVADFSLASAHKDAVISLTKPAAKFAPVTTQTVDAKNKALFKKHRFFSDSLLEQITNSLEKKEQVLLFHNRRGTAPTTMCSDCGWLAECQTCFLPLTLHADRHVLLCHLCGQGQPIPPTCPVCHQPTVIFKGIGTKLIESEITKLFPKAKIARFDADTKQEDMLHNRYQELYDGTIDILIGTQIVAKGLDLPNLTLVGVVQADSGLILPDFQAGERTFQLIFQVMGRVGRGAKPGTVIVQTYQPHHPTIQQALQRNYTDFYTETLKTRAVGHFPPFWHLLKLTCAYKTEKSAIAASQKLAKNLKLNTQLKILGPAPAFYERQNGMYRWQIIVKSKKRDHLVQLARNLPAPWQFDLDPTSIL